MEIKPHIPSDVIAAARLVENYFSENHSDQSWQLMGICSRDHAFKVKGLSELADDRLDKLRAVRVALGIYGE